MSTGSHAPARATAALLRDLADGCSSWEELRARAQALSLAEAQALLRDVAALLESLPAPVAEGARRADPGTAERARAPQLAPRQESFGFGGPVPPASQAAGSNSPGAQPRATAPSAAPRKLILYSDGASRGNPGPAGAGAVLMKPDGAIVARLGKYLGRQTNNHAEYMALIIGLRAALELGATEIEMVADSELLVKQIKKLYRVKNEHLKALYDEATALISRFRQASIRHVLREYNQEADEMSNRAIDERM